MFPRSIEDNRSLLFTSMQTCAASGSVTCKTYGDIEDDGHGRNEVKNILRRRKRVKTRATDGREPDKIVKVSRDNGKGKATAQIYKGRNVGKLAKLLEMPMDILCEISRHLGPLDLLQLSRSTKGFNRILMSRNSKPIWRAARATYPELPDCPPDMSEPEYARMMFLKECHVCLIGRAVKAVYELRTCLCSYCRASYIAYGEVQLQITPGLTKELLECLPAIDCSKPRTTRRPRFYKIAAERIVSRYNKAIPSTLSDEEAQKAKTDFIQSRKSLMSQIPDSARQLSEWALNQENAKQMSNNEALTRRQESIHAKLLELGYTPRDIPPSYYSTEWSNIIHRPRDLTPRIWTNIRPKLENQIASYKIHVEESDRLDRKNSRLSELQGYLLVLLNELTANNPKFYFPVVHAITLPTCVTVMEENDFGNAITEEKWTEIKDQVLSEIYAVTEESENFLISTITSLDLKLIPKSLTIPKEVDKEFIMASTTYFACNECDYEASYPRLRGHSCFLTSTKHPETGFAFDPLRTIVAQKLLASLPKVDDTNDIMTKFVKCNVCLVRIQWLDSLRHFYPEDIKHPSAPYVHCTPRNCHTLEEAIQEVGDRPLITVEDDKNGN